MSAELLNALDQLEKEKGISKEVIICAIEEALNASYGKNLETPADTRVEYNRENGQIKLYARKTVVEEVTDENRQLSLAEARTIDPEFELDDVAEFEITPSDFGRLASQKAKQIIIQKIREEERNMIYDQYVTKEKDIVSGTVQRIESRQNGEKIIYVDLGKIEAVLLPSEQVPDETYKFNERIKAFVVEVKKTSKEPKILISRTHPGLIKRLFELEVPEIHDGIVEIKGIAREAGSRTKMSVFSKDENIEPVGACVGQKGTRVQVIVDELRGERIDIIKWSEDPAELIGNSLSPAKVVSVEIDEEEKNAAVIVPDQQLSLAIGKEGQNVRLAAKLTGWKIDIKSESQARDSVEKGLFQEAEPAEFSEEKPEDAEEKVTDSGEAGRQQAEEE